MKLKPIEWRDFSGLYISRVLGMNFSVETRGYETIAYFMGETIFYGPGVSPEQTEDAKQACHKRATEEIFSVLQT